MKIKSLVITAVLATAILCFSAPAPAHAAGCMLHLSTLSTADQMSCLQETISDLMAQIAAMQAQQTNPTPAPTPTVWCHTFNTYLAVGVDSPEVMSLEQALQTEGIYPAGQEYYSKFDETVADAVVQFQVKYQIRPTGTVGPLTRARLNSLYGCATPAPQPACTPNWQCIWGPCTNGSQGQVAADSNNCGVPQQRPIACPTITRTCALPTQPSITVTSPNGGETLVSGQQYAIKWTSQNLLANSTLHISVNNILGAMSGNPSIQIVSNLPTSTTSYTWTVQPNTGNNGYGLGIKEDLLQKIADLFVQKASAAAYSNQYIIQICNQSGTICGSSNMFYINACTNGTTQSCSPNGTSGNQTCVNGQWDSCVASNQNYVTVTSPNGGETLTTGQTMNITWATNGLRSGDNVYIALVNDVTGKQYGIVTTIGSQTTVGQYSWIIPSTINYDSIVGNKFKISITYSPSYTSYTDSSDNYFSIVAPTSTSCSATTINGYSIPATSNNVSITVSKKTSVVNGAQNSTTTFTCNNGIFTAGAETSNITCNTGYSSIGTSCVASQPSSPNCASLYSKIQAAWHTTCGSLAYDSSADVDKDKTVGSGDYALFSTNFQNETWCGQQLSNTTNPCVTTSMSGANVGGYSWYLGSGGQSCDAVCASHGGCNSAGTTNYAGSGGTWTNCSSVLSALGATSGTSTLGDWPAGTGAGCYKESTSGSSSQVVRDTSVATTCSASFPTYSRACACGSPVGLSSDSSQSYLASISNALAQIMQELLLLSK